MEEHLQKRPEKRIFPQKLQDSLREKAVQAIKSKMLPNDKIIKILLIGSSVKNSFGEYSPPGFRGSLFSDFDFIVFVKDDYKIPKWLNKEPAGKPFSDEKLNLAYRNKKFIDDKYDIEVFFVRENNMHNPKIIEESELAGIPMTEKSKNKHIVIYSQ
jgi:hypothetical protein